MDQCGLIPSATWREYISHIECKTMTVVLQEAPVYPSQEAGSSPTAFNNLSKRYTQRVSRATINMKTREAENCSPDFQTQ